MTILKFTNNTPFLVMTSTVYQPPYYGNSWYGTPPTVSIDPGATAEIGYLDDPTTNPGPSTWGWLYLYHDDGGGLQSGHQLQVFAESRPGGSIYGAVGPAAGGSSPNNPMPLGGASAVVDMDDTLPVLTYVFNGYETGIGQKWLAVDLPPLDLPCAIGTYLDIVARSTRLFFIGTSIRAEDAPEIFVAWVDLPVDNDIVGLLNDSTSWSVSQFLLPTWTQVGARSTPSALSRGSLATMDDNLVYFWNNADYNDGQITWRFLAAEYLYDGTSETYWGSPIQMQDPDGNLVMSAGNCGQYGPGSTWFTPDLAAATLPSAEDPAVCIAGLLRPAASGPTDRASTLELYCYRHDHIAAGTGQEKTFVWPATSVQTLAVGDLAAQAGLDATNIGLSLSFGFYTTYRAQTSATTAPPETWMVVSLAAADASQAALFVLPFDVATATVSTQAAATSLVSTSSEPVVQCDASGRVAVLWNSNDGAEQLETMIIPNNEEPTSAMLASAAIAVRAISGNTVAPFWWMCDQSTCATSTSPVDGDSAYPPGTDPTALRFPIYRMLCYQGGPLRCAAQLVGWCEQTSGVNGPPVPKQGLTRKLLVGLIDGPVPVPGANLAAANPGKGGTYNTVTYGRASDASSGYSVQSSLGWGVKSTAGFTVGYGPAWDVSVSSATTKSASEQDETTLQTYLPVPSSYDDTGTVTTHGYALSADVTMTALRFQLIEPGLPPLYIPQAATDAAVFVQFQVSFSDSTDQWSFEPYTATPGDLHSYTAPAIDQRMQELRVTNQVNYVESVIEPASVPLKVNYSGNNPNPEQTTFFLSWDTGVMGTAKANASVDGFQEQGWSLNTQDYAGFSGGFSFGANDPQVAVGITAWNFSVMAGLLLTDSNDTTEATGSSWELEIDGSGPGMPEEPSVGVANHYEFTMYLLPSSTQWTAELIQGLTVQKENGQKPIWATLDPSEIVAGSAPWRITFLVTQIREYNAATGEYETTFPPSSP